MGTKPNEDDAFSDNQGEGKYTQRKPGKRKGDYMDITTVIGSATKCQSPLRKAMRLLISPCSPAVYLP